MKTTRYEERTPLLWDTLLLGHGDINVLGRYSFVVPQCHQGRAAVVLGNPPTPTLGRTYVPLLPEPQNPTSARRPGGLVRPLFQSRSPKTIE